MGMINKALVRVGGHFLRHLVVLLMRLVVVNVHSALQV